MAEYKPDIVAYGRLAPICLPIKTRLTDFDSASPKRTENFPAVSDESTFTAVTFVCTLITSKSNSTKHSIKSTVFNSEASVSMLKSLSGINPLTSQVGSLKLVQKEAKDFKSNI